MGKQIGRNAPCPCGSGKKYKKCCPGEYEGEKPPSTLRPEWHHDRRGYINKIKAQEKIEKERRRKELFESSTYMGGIGTSEHPLTGDLSRFTTTAG